MEKIQLIFKQKSELSPSKYIYLDNLFFLVC